MRESGARNTKRAPTRLTPPSRRWVRLSAHYRTSDHDFFRWVLFRSARVSRPRRMADRKLGSFASVISQLFVLSHNPQTTNTRSVWLRSGAFLSPPVPLPSASLTTGHYPLASRSTLHAPRAVVRRDQRGQVVRRRSPAGYCLPPTAELPKTERDPISTSGPSIFSMSPNQAIPAGKSMDSSPLAAAHPLRVLSWPRRSTPVSSGVPAGWPPAAMPVLSSLWQAQYLCFPRFIRGKRTGLEKSGRAC